MSPLRNRTYDPISLIQQQDVCLRVCLLPISSGTAGPIWLYFFLLAPSWSWDGFRPKKFRIRDPDFPEIRKNKSDPGSGFFCQKPPLAKTELTQKISQIGPAVPEEIVYKHTHKQTSCCFSIEIIEFIFNLVSLLIKWFHDKKKLMQMPNVLP